MPGRLMAMERGTSDGWQRDERGAGARPAPAGGGRNALPGEISLVRFANVLLRYRRVVAGLALAGAILVVGVTLVLPRTYTTESSFLPQTSESDLSRLAGLAAQFGFSVSAARGGDVPQFYVDLLRSRELLEATVQGPYEPPIVESGPRADAGENDIGAEGIGEKEEASADAGVSLVHYYGFDDHPRDEAVDRAVERLRDDLRIRTRAETGLVELAVTTRSPALSYQVASRMLDLVSAFNLERRQSQAAAERAFIQERLGETEGELRAAENSLKAFLQQNRRYENSPDLRFEFERLQRRVDLRQRVYSSLAESLEQARIEEVRNTPVLTLVDAPRVPPRPDPRWLALKGTIGLLLGGMVGVFWAFGREFLTAAREEEPDDYAELQRLKGEAREDVRVLWRKVRRPTGRTSRVG